MKRIISIITAAVLVLALMPFGAMQPETSAMHQIVGSGNYTAEAATGDKYTVNISGTYEYSGPQEMMQYINEERQSLGRGTLTLDADLTDDAMQRAAEIAYYFSHTRPDGRDCYTVNSRAYGENIAAGNRTAQATYTQWYNSEGHYENMVRSYFTNIGIGHFEHNGIHYWVQLFSIDRTKTVETRTGEVPVKTQISIVEKSLSPLEFNGGLESAHIRETDKLELQISALNAGWTWVDVVFDADSFTWTSSNTAVATVSADGLVTPTGLGETTITAKVGSTATSINVKVSRDITKATVSGLETVEYTGSEIIPPLQVVYDGKVLQEGVDYEATYSSNVNAGTAYVEIRGLDGYVGTLTKYFTINRKYIEDLAEFKMKGWDCTGYEDYWACAEDNLEVYLNGEKLRLNKDYYIYTAGGDENGQLYQVGVAFKGNYAGSRLLKCLDDAAIEPIPDQAYTGKAIEPDFTLYWDKYSVGHPSCTYKIGEDYTVEYINNVEVGTATVKIIPVNGNYGSAQFTFRICKSIDDAAVADIPAVEYTGSAVKPDVKVTLGGKQLQKGTDYTVAYRNNTAAGTGTVVITGCGDYAGTIEKEFHIHKFKWVTDKAPTETATGIKHQECTACDAVRNKNTVAAAVPCTHVRSLVWEKGATCTEPGHIGYYVCEKYGTIYASGQSDKPITEADTVVPAKGHNFVTDNAIAATTHYAGKTAGSYCSRCYLVQKEQQDVPMIGKISLKSSKFVYNGFVRKPAVTVRDTEGNKLIKGTDYTVAYRNAAGTKIVNPKNVGTYKAIVTFKGNYSGSETKSFVINPKATSIKKLTKPAKKQIKVAWQKRTVQVTGYQIRYSTKQNMNGYKMVTVNKAKTNSRVIKGLKAKTKYYVQIRTYKIADGTRYVSAWSDKKYIKTK